MQTTKTTKRRLTLEALEDVDAGRLIDHQAVQAWAASLDTDPLLEVPPVMDIKRFGLR